MGYNASIAAYFCYLEFILISMTMTMTIIISMIMSIIMSFALIMAMTIMKRAITMYMVITFTID